MEAGSLGGLEALEVWGLWRPEGLGGLRALEVEALEACRPRGIGGLVAFEAWGA